MAWNLLQMAPMHRLVIAGALALAVAFCGRLGDAQEDADAGSEDDAGMVETEPAAAAQPENRYHRFTVGAFFGLGMAHALYEGDIHYRLKPRLAFDGGAYFIHHLSKLFAYDVGLELVGKGCLVLDNPLWEKTIPFRVLYLEIPLGVKIFFKGFAIGAAIAIDYAVYREFSDEGVNEWGDYNRFNLSPRLTLEYRIPVGGVASVVVGITGSIEVLDSADRIWGGDWSRYRNTNLMFDLGLEAGFGRGE